MAFEPAVSEPLSLWQRAKAILTKPKETWAQIARDMTPSGELFTRYVVPLAAIGPVCIFISSLISGGLFSRGIFAGTFSAVGNYAVSLISMLIMAFITSKFAVRNGGEASPRNAFKLIAYSSTAFWLAGVFILVPPLRFLTVLGFYSFYLFFEGIGPMMNVPEENRKRFAAMTIVCAILLNLVASSVIGNPAWNWHRDFDGRDRRERVVIVHGKDLDMSQLRDLGREIRDSVRDGTRKGIQTDQLQTLLPAAIGNYKRTSVESEDSGQLGAKVDGTFEQGDRSFHLRIVDLAGFGAVAQIASAFGVEENHEDSDGYERVSTKNGGMIAEKWDKGDEEGSYATMVGKRFLIEAKGEAANIDELKSAVAKVDVAKLTNLAK